MAPKDFIELVKHYYLVSICVAATVITCAVLSRTILDTWVNFIGLGVLAVWAIWAGLYIHRVNLEHRRQ